MSFQKWIRIIIPEIQLFDFISMNKKYKKQGSSSVGRQTTAGPIVTSSNALGGLPQTSGGCVGSSEGCKTWY